MYFSDPLTIVLSNPGVSRLSEAQIARISPVGIGHANEAEAGVPYYDDIFDEDDECTTADISDPDGSIALGLGGIYYEEGMHYTATSERQKRVDVSEPPRSFTGTRPAAAMRSDGCAPGVRVRVRPLRG